MSYKSLNSFTTHHVLQTLINRLIVLPKIRAAPLRILRLSPHLEKPTPQFVKERMKQSHS
jgi:hypothetical protein